MASLTNQLEKDRRIEKYRDSYIQQQLQASEKAIDEQLDELSKLNQILVNALFIINGYYQHKRQWRKKRNG